MSPWSCNFSDAVAIAAVAGSLALLLISGHVFRPLAVEERFGDRVVNDAPGCR